jgi:hypothetical protein
MLNSGTEVCYIGAGKDRDVTVRFAVAPNESTLDRLRGSFRWTGECWTHNHCGGISALEPLLQWLTQRTKKPWEVSKPCGTYKAQEDIAEQYRQNPRDGVLMRAQNAKPLRIYKHLRSLMVWCPDAVWRCALMDLITDRPYLPALEANAAWLRAPAVLDSLERAYFVEKLVEWLTIKGWSYVA